MASMAVKLKDLFVAFQTEVNRYLGRLAPKKCRSILINFICISLDIKLSYIYDESTCTFAKMTQFVNSLTGTATENDLPWIKSNIDLSTISVLCVSGDSVLTNIDKLKTYLKQIIEEPCRINVICVEDSLTKPRNLAREEQWLILEKHCNYLLDNIERNILEFDLPPDLNGTTIYGLLLGFPVVYFYSTQSQGNCLANVTLRVISVACKVKHTLSDTNVVVVSSFSYPEELSQSVNDSVSSWRTFIEKAAIESQDFEVTITEETRVLNSVAL